jgi:nucleoside-diphosphate-sugar epimerase
LLRAGHQVVATRRAGTKVAHLDDLAIEWREADLGSADTLARAFTGTDAVFHCAAAVTVKRDVTPEMTDANVTAAMRRDRTLELRRARHGDLGYTISPLEPAIADALAWFRAHGMAD